MEKETERITQNFPCESCITLPICRYKEKNRGNVARVHDLCVKCNKMRDYIDVVDIPGENDPNDIHTPCPLQGDRISYVIRFMGWLQCNNAPLVTAEQNRKRTYVADASPFRQKILKLARSYSAELVRSKEY